VRRLRRSALSATILAPFVVFAMNLVAGCDARDIAILSDFTFNEPDAAAVDAGGVDGTAIDAFAGPDVTTTGVATTDAGAADQASGEVGEDAGPAMDAASEAAMGPDSATPIAYEAGTTCDPTPRALFPTVVTPDGVYLVEGIPTDMPAPLSTTALIGLSADGGLDPSNCVTQSDVTVPIAEYGMGEAIVATSVYLLGGYTTTSGTTAVYRAEIADGGLTSFAVATLQGDPGTPIVLQVPRYAEEVVQTENYLYVVGGWTGILTPDAGAPDLVEIERAQVDPATGDFVTNFAPVSATLALPRTFAQTFQRGSDVYILGGATGAGGQTVIHDEIQIATVDSSGNLSSFAQVGALPTDLAMAGIYTTVDTLYLLGGTTAYDATTVTFTATTAVLQAPAGADGALGTFTTSSAVLPYATFAAGEATLGQTTYLIGGLSGSGGLSSIVAFSLQ